MFKAVAVAIVAVAAVVSTASAQMRSVGDFGPHWDVLEGIGPRGHPTLALETFDEEKEFGIELSGDRPMAITLVFINKAWNLTEDRIAAQVQIGDVISSYEARRINNQYVEIVTSDLPEVHQVAKTVTITLQGYAPTTIPTDRPGSAEALAAFQFRAPQIALAMTATILSDIGKDISEFRNEIGK